MSNPNPAHKPAGTSDGGQFAKTAQAEAVGVPELDGAHEVRSDRIELSAPAPDLPSMDDDDEDENCAECGEPLADSEGEGYDGLCGTCADKAEAEGRWG